MQFTFSTIAAVAALIGSSAAHMIMADPPQWVVPGESLGPLDPSGSDFPCANGVAVTTASRTYTAGESAILQVQGSAVHGGGSGQMLITYDMPPTASSVWRVMVSFEGDHPVKADGNLPADPYLLHAPISYTIPEGLPSGTAVVAWSWFNRVGNREMYMKCATVAIEGKTASVSNLSDDPAMLALPTFFRANSGNGCTVPEGIDAIAFKYPGTQVDRKGGYTAIAVDCDDSQPGTGSGDETPAPTTTADVPDATSTDEPTPTDEAPETSATAYPTDPAGGDEESGGDEEAEPVPTSTAAPTVTNPSPTTTGSPTFPQPTATGSPTSPQPTATGSPDSGTCVEGAVYCHDDRTWSMCGSGRIQLIGQVPAGMKCVDGIFSADKKRSIRFSSEHMRHRRH
ncbi:hypothetical protein BZA05DRAFT_266392 [Tricharina praecox]|uniref:uncharacterized protein n=1 Tax=Tricharina praecox TaxID=43433 RepID=UPI00221FC5CF|nr:uncharacterized protein BZA05DRAFT_266392 [Tricharina praecox]KAI5854461.1 hypothetical protein BZA05DRAFT_266392 [Tricharina praecox]